MITTKEKKKVLDDWQEQFPILSRYSSSYTCLCMKLDIVLIGLKLDKIMSNEYRPTFICCPLWHEKVEIDDLVFWYELINRKKLQFDIEYQLHNNFFQEAIECTEKQFGFLFKEKVLLSDIYLILDKIISSFASKHNPICLHRLFEFKLALALYLDDAKLMNKVKCEIEKESKFWEPKRFTRLFMKSIEEWKYELYNKFNDRIAFIEQINQNSADKKISKLKSGHIIF